VSRDLSHLREQYQRAGLRRATLAPDPVTQFEGWWDEWAATEPFDGAACILATADGDGRPTARFVLCRGVDARGFVIYTNQTSHKARDLAENPRAALTFGWLALERQVRIEGAVTLATDEEADAYWDSRPRVSQLGAWASDQSEVVADRAELERHLHEVELRFGGADAETAVPRPTEWGGYRIGIDRAEFWQGRIGRLHDRFEYRRSSGSGAGPWTIDRLAP